VNIADNITEDVRGSSYVWVPRIGSPLKDNSIKITDLKDGKANWGARFEIAGGNATWAAPVVPDTNQPDDLNTDLTAKPATGLSTGVKTGIGIGGAVVAIIAGLLIWLWIRHKREKSRLGNQPMRTMSTDNSPQNSPSSNRQGDKHSTPTRPGVTTQSNRSRSHTLSSASSTSPFRKLFFSEKTEPLDQVSTGSTLESHGDPEKGYYSPTHGELANNERGVIWDDNDGTPRNDRNISSPSQSELDGTHSNRHNSRYGSLGREPDSPTPQRRYVSAPVRLENNSYRQASAFPSQEGWELSANTPQVQHSRVAPLPPQELSSTPILSGAIPPQAQAQVSNDPYRDVTFGSSDDPDAIVSHLAAQREKVRAEKERLRRLKELDGEEEEIERQMREARERRLA